MASRDSEGAEESAAGSTPQQEAQRRRGPQRPFPAAPFEEAEAFARQIYEFASGQPVRRLSLFDHIGKSPESGPSRQAITNAGKYGLIRGSYKADLLELTSEGRAAVGDDIPTREKTRARIKLAILDIEPFEMVYKQFAGNKLPAKSALVDAMIEASVPRDFVDEGVDTLVVNLRHIGSNPFWCRACIDRRASSREPS
jgi:hypothetical protein